MAAKLKADAEARKKELERLQREQPDSPPPPELVAEPEQPPQVSEVVDEFAGDLDLDEDPNDMVDSKEKYDIIVARAKKGGYPVWNDANLDVDDEDEARKFVGDGVCKKNLYNKTPKFIRGRESEIH
jgi:hypothetical protein